ncbi:hypothetical protein KCU74_g18, partial [Aureobasidium melanogenum]
MEPSDASYLILKERGGKVLFIASSMNFIAAAKQHTENFCPIATIQEDQVADQDFRGAKDCQLVQSANIGLAIGNLTEDSLAHVQVDEGKTNSGGYTARFAHSADDLLRLNSDSRHGGTRASRIFVGTATLEDEAGYDRRQETNKVASKV